MNRTFSKMEKGGIRGSIFLLLITTAGCSFFYLPYYSKKCGILLTTLLLIIPAVLSYYSSTLMYYGFKFTKAVTYDECINRIFGRKIGLLANIIVFIHVFGSVVSTWVFSYVFCSSTASTIFGGFSDSGKNLFLYLFFGVTFILMFMSVTFANIDKLKFIAIFGFLILVYLMVLFMALTPEYFNYYNDSGQFKLEGAIFSGFVFKTYGLTQYIFLNQYSIIPLCSNVKDVSFRRIKKVILRAMVVLFFLYFAVMVTGYFSQPSISLAKDKLTELFILRPYLEGYNDLALEIGKGLFGVTLFIGMLIKSQFFILYFNQIIKNVRTLIRGGSKIELLKKKYLETQNNQQKEPLLGETETKKVMKKSKSVGRCLKYNTHSGFTNLPMLTEQPLSKEVENSEQEGNKLEPKNLFNIKISNCEEDVTSKDDNDNKVNNFLCYFHSSYILYS